MIRLHCRRFDHKNNNTPILSNAEIDDFAHAVLKDYKPKLLKEAGRIRFEHFLESYLGVTLEFHDIYNADPMRPILGATAFNNGELTVFDKENMCVSKIPVTARTVVIDNSVMAEGKEGLALFTGLHEGGHVLLHSQVYTTHHQGQIDLFNGASLPPVVCCRRENIENFAIGGRGFQTAAEWREHHADYFAAALAMPNATFRPFVNCLLRENDIWKGKIVTDIDEDLDYLAKVLLPEQISELYGVSKRAAFVKLKKAGFVIDKQSYERKNAQMIL